MNARKYDGRAGPQGPFRTVLFRDIISELRKVEQVANLGCFPRGQVMAQTTFDGTRAEDNEGWVQRHGVISLTLKTDTRTNRPL